MKGRETKVLYKGAEGPSAGRTARHTCMGENGLLRMGGNAPSTREQWELG